MMQPIEVEVVFPLLMAIGFNCRRCNAIFSQLPLDDEYRNSCWNEYPDEWKKSIQRLYDWVGKASDVYKHRIRFRMIDAQSPLGLWKQIRHRARYMPAFIIDRKRIHTGWDTERLESIIDEQIREAAGRLEARAKGGH